MITITPVRLKVDRVSVKLSIALTEVRLGLSQDGPTGWPLQDRFNIVIRDRAGEIINARIA